MTREMPTKKELKIITRKEIRKAPNCANCSDKGWSSVLSNLHVASDSEMGESGEDKMFVKRNYCWCKKGRKLLYLES